MKLRENLRLSWRAIRGHKLRSTLTTLGVIIGIAAVITFVTLGASLQEDVVGQVGGEEASDIFVWAGPEDQNQGPGFGAEPVFTRNDTERIAGFEDVAAAIPYTIARSDSLTYGGDSVTRGEAVRATTPAYLAGEEFRAGGNFAAGTTEAVLTPNAAAMFETNVSVGDAIGVVRGDETTTLTVVGILNSSESLSAFEGFQGTPRIYTAPEAVGETRFLYLVVTAAAPQAVDAVTERVETYLQDESAATSSLPDDYVFKLQTSEQLLDQLRELLNVLTGFVTGIALISLVVGSIGIANIMLVSVTERTREIGIMKAVGAQRRDILTLFLTEAVILGVIGAIVGAALGAVVGFAGTQLIGFDAYVFPLEWTLIAAAVGILVGIVAGLYPAWNAAKTDPIDALRYE
ncbi:MULTISPECIES: ABC transporter permease [Salinibaculum]|uniref:ABC transporter permease n=1 Tax=Salinibaculum TaxID=2732368 RepID=UPI0030CBC7C3